MSEPESELWDEFESGIARYNCEVWSEMEEMGGNGGGETEAGFLEDVVKEDSHECSSTGSEMRVWLKCGMVDMSGERAHGLVDDIKSCSRVGSIRLHDGGRLCPN